MNVLITGGSGFIGKALLARLVFDPYVDKLYVLIRPTYRQTADERIEVLLTEFLPPELRAKGRTKIVPIAGDLTQDKLGISEHTLNEVIESIDQILHVGASTDLSAPIEVARSINLDGTRRILELADVCYTHGRLQRVDYISTAFVAGVQWGEVVEDDLVRGQSFANGYEQSKYECEILVRKFRERFPIAIYRPSVVVGDSSNGYTTHFKVLYWPVKILAKRIKGCVTPMSVFARVDLVPVDYVADGICALMKVAESENKTYHLTAGRGHEQWITGIAKYAAKSLNVSRYPIIPVFVYKFIKRTPLRRLLSEELWEVYRLFEPYLLYFKGASARFNNRASVKVLAKYGVESRPWQEYREVIFSYCMESRFGKRKPLPEYEYYRYAVERAFTKIKDHTVQTLIKLDVVGSKPPVLK
jgi:long-chain acyl-CoA synthetase